MICIHTMGQMAAEGCQAVAYVTCQKSPQTIRQLPHPCARNHEGLKTKEAHSLGPGWRVLLGQCPNTRQSAAAERLTLLWVGGGEDRSLYVGENGALYVSVYVHVCTQARALLCVWGWGQLQLSTGRKEGTGNPYWTPHLRLNSSKSRWQVFFLQGSGDRRLTICPFSWHTTPKPDVPTTSGVACRRLSLAFNLFHFYKSAVTKLQTLNRDGPGFWSRHRPADRVAFDSPWASDVWWVKRRELSLPLKTVTSIKHNTWRRADTKNQASSSLSLSPKAIRLFQPSF